MKIAIYGISRSGKDYLIEQIVQNFPNKIKHIKGSAELEKIAMEMYNVPFNRLNDNCKATIRKEFVNRLSNYEIEYENIVVDGHYSFPNDKGFKVVYDNADYVAYDMVFYIKRSEETIKRQALQVGKEHYKEYLLSDGNAIKWQKYEIYGMTKIYENSNKDFYILDEGIENNISFIIACLQKPRLSIQTTNSILNRISQMIVNVDTILLTDLDKTISVNDSTYDYIKYCNLDKAEVKNIFEGDYYTGYQQYCFHKYLQTSKNTINAVNYASRKMIINEKLVTNIINGRPSNSLIIGITTGIADIWHVKNKEINLFDIIIGVSYANNEINEMVTKKIKGLLAKELKDSGHCIVAIGDSIIDWQMLQNSTKGYLVSNGNLDKRIEKEIYNIFHKNIYQLNFNYEKYEKIDEKDSIW